MLSALKRMRVFLVLAGIALALPLILASHWSGMNWHDIHYNYPNRPSGYNQIVNTFGQPCSNAADWNKDRWRASNGEVYEFRFHRKLGGSGTSIVRDNDGRSTNLDNDVWGHINTRHLANFVKPGIWGYFCRYIHGTHTWSTHAWGIAVDVSSAHEHVGHYHSHVNFEHSGIWTNHRWVWGKSFGDAMHFQYADNY